MWFSEFDIPKFVFTDEIMNFEGHILHRIKAIRDFGLVKAGNVGGWLEKESNLRHGGSCWVFDEAKVFDDGFVEDDAEIHNFVVVRNFGNVKHNSKVFDNVEIFDNGRIIEDSVVRGDVKIFDSIVIDCGKKGISGDLKFLGCDKIFCQSE